MTVLNKSILFDRFCKNRDVKMRTESGMAVQSWNIMHFLKKCLDIS